jgi:hypothetical protein
MKPPTRLFGSAGREGYGFLKRVILGIALIGTAATAEPLSANPVDARSGHWDYKGVAVTGYWIGSFDSPYFQRQLDYYRRIGANAFQLVPVVHQEHAGSSRIEPDCWREKGISDKELVQAIRYAHQIGAKVNLKPHLAIYPEGVPQMSRDDWSALESALDSYPKEQQELEQCYARVDSDGSAKLRSGVSDRQLERCTQIIKAVMSHLFWRARISPADPGPWFRSYQELLIRYLDIALTEDVEVFTIGTEMVCLTRPEYLGHWSKLVKNLKARRAAYRALNPGSGPLRPLITYAAHENEVIGTPNDEERPSDYRLNCGEDWGDRPQADPLERATILEPGAAGERASPAQRRSYRRFWDLFDLVSLTVYFKLGTEWPHELEETTTDGGLEAVTGTLAAAERDGEIASTLRARWNTKIEEIARWRQAVAPGKPVILAELGYRSVDFGHYKPYQSSGVPFPRMPLKDPRFGESKRVFTDDRRIAVNTRNQRNAYQAAMDVLSDVDWIKGVFLWQEEIKTPPVYASREDNSYSLIGKPAAVVVEQAYTGVPATGWNQVPDCTDFGFDRFDRYDLDIGGGTAITRLEDDSSFAWIKGRVRPLSICFGSSLVQELQFGVWASGAWGEGKDAASESRYSWDRGLVGLTGKLLGRGLTWDLDVGGGRLNNSSNAKGGRFRSWQHDDVFSASTHLEWRRRDFGHRGFPKMEIDYEGVWSTEAKERRTREGRPLEPDPLDRDRSEAVLAVSLFDQRIGGSQLRVTPSVALGHVWQKLDRNYEKAGVGLTLGLDKKGDSTDLATLRCFYDDTKGGIWNLNLWLDVLEIGRVLGQGSSHRL